MKVHFSIGWLPDLGSDYCLDLFTLGAVKNTPLMSQKRSNYSLAHNFANC